MLDRLALAVIKLSPDQTGLPNSVGDVGVAITRTIALLMSVLGGLAVVFIMVGGVQIATAAGSPTRLKQGRETVLYAVVGLVVAAAAYAVVSFIGNYL